MVAEITTSGSAFDPGGSAALSASIDVAGDPGAGCAVVCVRIATIKLSESHATVRVTAVDENRSGVRATVIATWVLPDGSTVARSAAADRKGRARRSVPAPASGTYSVSIDGVTAGGLTQDADAGVVTGSITVT